MTPGIPELLTRARRSLDAARRLQQDGDADFAVSRAYYAMCYGAEALLLRRGLSFSRHAGVIAALQREYVTSGELSRTHHGALHQAFNDRNVADYDARGVSAAVAEATLRAAAAFLDAAEDFSVDDRSPSGYSFARTSVVKRSRRVVMSSRVVTRVSTIR
jgi:uncharacterized protein (UPF0332 family)